MTIADYFSDLKNQITSHPLVSTCWFNEDIRSRAIGSFKARLVFHNGVILDFREFVLLQANRVTKLSYSYNCRKQRLIFRYDNAPHHNHLPGSPHHKHFSNGRVISSVEPALKQILREIELHI